MLSHQLKQLGVQNVRFAAKNSEAKRLLESSDVDIVLIDEDISEKGEDGRSLIDDLRRCGQMDMQVIVFITSSWASYAHVTEAAESGVDSYLLRPYSQGTLEIRAMAAVRRREALQDIYNALKAKRWDDALEGCLTKFATREPFWLYAARIAAEIYILQGNPLQAQSLYEEIIRHEAVPWAKLGVGRALVEQGRHDAAIEHLQTVIAEHPEQTDAYDIMGRAHLEQGNPQGALEVYKLAVEATPSSVSRLQRLGAAAYFAKDFATASQMLERSIYLGGKSKSFDPQAFFVLALIYFNAGKTDSLRDLVRQLIQIADAPMRGADKLGRIKAEVESILFASEKKWDEAKEIVQTLALAHKALTYDFDSASNLISLMSALAANGTPIEDDQDIIESLGLRFAHCKLAASWLANAAAQHEPYASHLAEAYERVFQLTQDWVRQCITGNAPEAAESLVSAAERHLNARIIEIAEKMIERHAAKLAKSAELLRRIEQVKRTNDPVQLKRNPASRELRHPGGISLLNRLASEGADKPGDNPA